MKVFAVIFTLMTSAAWAKDLSLECQLKHNENLVFTRELILKSGQKNVSVGSYDLIEVIVSSSGASSIELQIYNASEPTRSYASGELKDKTSKVELALWSREYILAAACRLK